MGPGLSSGPSALTGRLVNSRDTKAGVEWGVVLGVLHLLVWGSGLLGLLLSAPNEWSDAVWVVPSILGMTWLYVGLFITAHDAMHGSLSPRHPRLNDAIGATCTTVYAALSYSALKEAHHRHHAHVGTESDPDWVTSAKTSVFFEFRRFILSYLSFRSIATMVVMSWVFLFFGITLWNMVLFWVIPSFASALQLYTIGTWFPHRPGADLDETHRARSLELSTFWSLLACYHFGYHVEHHTAPHVPWWRLPAYRRRQGALEPT